MPKKRKRRALRSARSTSDSARKQVKKPRKESEYYRSMDRCYSLADKAERMLAAMGI